MIDVDDGNYMQVEQEHECHSCSAPCGCGEDVCIMCKACAHHECVNCGNLCDCGYGYMDCWWCEVCQYGDEEEDETE
jgi:hypothetical protein